MKTNSKKPTKKKRKKILKNQEEKQSQALAFGYVNGKIYIFKKKQKTNMEEGNGKIQYLAKESHQILGAKFRLPNSGTLSAKVKS